MAMIVQLFLPEEKRESAVPVSRLVDSPIQRDSLKHLRAMRKAGNNVF